MAFWCCAQLETGRSRLALHCLTKVAGYEVYNPQLLEQRRRSGRKITVVSQLFPSYAFVWVVAGWWNARWAPGVLRLVMDGEVPARVPDAVISEIRGRECNGLIQLPKPRSGLVPGTKVRIVDGPFASKVGVLILLKPRERVLVLLSMLGGERRVDLASKAIEVV